METSTTSLNVGDSLETGFFNTTKQFTQTFVSGSLVNKYTASFTATSNLQLSSSGGLYDGFGNLLNFGKWMYVSIQNNDTSGSHTLAVGGGTHPLAGFTNITVIPPGPSCMVICANTTSGEAVTYNSTDQLNISGTCNSYDIVILGA